MRFREDSAHAGWSGLIEAPMPRKDLNRRTRTIIRRCKRDKLGATRKFQRHRTIQYRHMNGHSIIPVFAVIACFGLARSAVADNAPYGVPTEQSLTLADQNRCRPLSQRVPYNYDDDADFAIVRQKSDEGDVDAMNRLGIMYASGRGIDKNYGRALIWFRRSALLGYAPAMANLGTMYQKGVGTRRNYRQAYKWFRVALALGVPEEDHDAIVFKLGMI